MKLIQRFYLAGVLFCFLSATCTTNDTEAGSHYSDVADIRDRKTGSDWPAFLGPTGDSKSPETGIRTSWPEAGPPVVWQKDIGEGYGAPTVAKGRLFLFDRHDDQARLTCMKSETGEELWRFEYATDYEDIFKFSNGPRTCPVIDDERVYIFGVEGWLHCLSTSGGQLLWKLNTKQQFNVVQNFFGVGSTPVIEGDLLIVPVGGSPPNDFEDVYAAGTQIQTSSTGIVAFDKHTGEIVYKSIDELAGYGSPVLATINGRRWGFLFARGGLVGFNPATGAVDFHYPWRSKKMESVNASNPVVAGDRVFISESYGLGSSVLKVKPGGYEIAWKDEKRSRDKSMLLHWNTAIHHQGYLYGCSGMSSGNAELRCIEFNTGKVVWSEKTGERTSLLYVDEHFISLGEHGTLTLLRANPEKPEIISKVKPVDAQGENLLNHPAWAAPVLSNGFLYVRAKGRLACLDLL